MARPIIKAALDTIEIYFITNGRSKQGTTGNVVTQKNDCKNSEFENNSRTSLKKWVFSSTFPVPKKIQNNSRSSRNSKTIGHPETLCMELDTSPQLFFSAPN